MRDRGATTVYRLDGWTEHTGVATKKPRIRDRGATTVYKLDETHGSRKYKAPNVQHDLKCAPLSHILRGGSSIGRLGFPG